MLYLSSGKTWAKPSAFSMAAAVSAFFCLSRNTVASRMFVPMPNWREVSLAMANWSPVTILIFTPICTALAMVAFACSRGGSNIGKHANELPLVVLILRGPHPRSGSRVPRSH